MALRRTPVKKPPPKNPGNMAGRKLRARAIALMNEQGGLVIEAGQEGCKSEVSRALRSEEEVARLRKVVARPDRKPKPKSRKVDFFKFAREQK